MWFARSQNVSCSGSLLIVELQANSEAVNEEGFRNASASASAVDRESYADLPDGLFRDRMGNLDPNSGSPLASDAPG